MIINNWPYYNNIKSLAKLMVSQCKIKLYPYLYHNVARLVDSYQNIVTSYIVYKYITAI